MKLFKMKSEHNDVVVGMDGHEMSQYLQLLNALIHLSRHVSHTPGQTHVERWIL